MNGHSAVNISEKWGQLDNLKSFWREKNILQRIRNQPGFRYFNMRSKKAGAVLSKF